MRVLVAALFLCLPASGALVESTALPGVLIDDRGSAKERAMLERGLELIARSATANRLEERRRRLGPFAVGFKKLDTSTTVFSGAHGETDIHADPPRANVNEEVMRSSHAFVETLAHEIYGHGILLREKEYMNADIGHTIYNEGWSFAVGNVVALEAGEPVDEEPRLDALAVSTRTYALEVMFQDSKDRRVEFTFEEARDPRKSVAARLKEIARRRKSVDGRRRESLIWRHRLEHFTKVHRMNPEDFRELYDSVDGTLRFILPAQKELLDVAEKHLADVRDYFNEPEGKRFVAEMTALSKGPYLRSVAAEFAELSRRIGELRAPPSAPAAGSVSTPGPAPRKQLTWDDLEDLRVKDLADHPEHWKGAPEPAAEPAPPWVAP